MSMPRGSFRSGVPLGTLGLSTYGCTYIYTHKNMGLHIIVITTIITIIIIIIIIIVTILIVIIIILTIITMITITIN